MTELMNQMAVAFDLPILDWIQANLKSDLLDTVMPIITLFGDGGVFWIAIAVLLLFFRKTRKIGLGMGFALLLGLVVCNITLKPLVGRIRPYDLQENLGVTIPLLTDRMHDYSFPSGHTIASFEASTVLLKNNKLMGIPAVILAFLIAFSRLYLYVHYPTDVIFSFFAGILFGLVGNALAGKVVTRLPVRRKGRYEAA